jgi:ectoine hydroxylase-related dioxygenase (phytanoyl-CoA dioxygenase family)
LGGLQLQIALVASDDTEVVPGSHLRWDTLEEYHIRRGDNKVHAESDDMPGALRVALQPGDAVAFNACALHRGRYHSDKQRRTIMLTYQRNSQPAQDNYFTRQPWVLEPGYLDGTSPQTRELFGSFVRKYGELWKQPPKWKT